LSKRPRAGELGLWGLFEARDGSCVGRRAEGGPRPWGREDCREKRPKTGSTDLESTVATRVDSRFSPRSGFVHRRLTGRSGKKGLCSC